MTIIITGSPRKGRYSDRIAEAYHEISGGELIYARDVNASPCKGCGYCRGKGNGRCIQNDDMQPIIEKVRKADTLVLVSPIYWWQVTGTIKNVIDRLYALDVDGFKGKRLVVIMNGGSEPDDKEYELLEGQFKEMADYIGMSYMFLGVGTPEGQEEEFQRKLEGVRELARKNG